MRSTTINLLSLVDSMPDGREGLFEDIASLISRQKFFSIESVAQRYEVSIQTIKHWQKQGLINPSFKVNGGTVRFTLNDLLKFENEQKGTL